MHYYPNLSMLQLKEKLSLSFSEAPFVIFVMLAILCYLSIRLIILHKEIMARITYKITTLTITLLN